MASLFKTYLIKLILPLLVLSACAGKRNQLQSPDGYNLNKPVIVKLPVILNEISGISYYHKDNTIFAVEDERGILYKIFYKEKVELQHWQFAPSEDFEDICLVDSTFYVLQSKGTIVGFTFNNKDTLRRTEYPTNLEKSEFESLYYDSTINSLVMICKDCDSDKKAALTTYFFNLKTQAFSNGFTIDVAPVAAALGKDKVRFKPSAANIHPITGDLYMVSAVNNVLVVATNKGVIKNIYPLNKQLFKQPEGITFSNDGAMMISNEAADEGVGNILFYPYKPLKK